MDIFDFKIENWFNIIISVNWLALLILVFIFFLMSLVAKKLIASLSKRSITINEVELGIGSNNKVKIKFEYKDVEIAYKLWIEMSTRKIAIPFDEDNDVIIEVYNSWYNFFNVARELIKDLPADRIKHSKELIKLTERVLNSGLRPHLTKWQSRFRYWYNEETKNNTDKSPQEIQKRYGDYNELIVSLKETNTKLINYNNLMKAIAFNE